MHIMTGAMRSTSITTLETATGLQSLANSSNIKVPTRAAKFKRLTDHPMHSWISKSTKGKLKRSSFIHHSRILERQQPEPLDHMPEAIQTHVALPCWERQKRRSLQPSLRASQVSKKKQPSQTLWKIHYLGAH